jgi:hypothetical protein
MSVMNVLSPLLINLAVMHEELRSATLLLLNDITVWPDGESFTRAPFYEQTLPIGSVSEVISSMFGVTKAMLYFE